MRLTWSRTLKTTNCKILFPFVFHSFYLACRFAIKTIFCAKDADMGPVMHEVKFLRLSRHPCIIDIHDAFLMTNPR